MTPVKHLKKKTLAKAKAKAKGSLKKVKDKTTTKPVVKESLKKTKTKREEVRDDDLCFCEPVAVFASLETLYREDSEPGSYSCGSVSRPHSSATTCLRALYYSMIDPHIPVFALRPIFTPVDEMLARCNAKAAEYDIANLLLRAFGETTSVSIPVATLKMSALISFFDE